MAVYTLVKPQEAQPLFSSLHLGRLLDLEGCSSGIENTNYFASTERGEFVLTLFERLSFEQLPYYLQLMKHLAAKGIAVPAPQSDDRGEILHLLVGKPASVVTRLSGQTVLEPKPQHVRQVARSLAQMHLAVADFPLHQPNLRGLSWWIEVAPALSVHLNPQQLAILQSELTFQQLNAKDTRYLGLPRGAIHADLFRDNVMFEGDVLSGIFDFYFAGDDAFVFDVAVCLNDWCIDHAKKQPDFQLAHDFLNSYQSVRSFTGQERELFPAFLRAAALRFWCSRLWDWYAPRAANMLKPHDPSHFELLLSWYRTHAASLLQATS